MNMNAAGIDNTNRLNSYLFGLMLNRDFEMVKYMYEIYNTRAPFYSHGLTLIPVWISNYMPSKVWEGITDPFPNL